MAFTLKASIYDDSPRYSRRGASISSIPNQIINACKVNPLTATLARSIGRYLCRDTKAYIFVASTGRCGTSSLQEIFASVPGAVSLHEPHPTMSGQVLRNYNEGSSRDRDKVFYEQKVPHIYWASRRARYYLETNHMFIKCFAGLALKEFGDRLRVIYIYRDKLKTACSHYNKHSLSKKDIDEIDNWVLNPKSRRNLLDITNLLHENPSFESNFYRCLWYCYETEARARDFIDKHPNVMAAELATEDLNSLEKVSNMLSMLDIDIPEDLLSRIGIRKNVNPRRSLIPDSIDPVEVAVFQAKCETLLNRLLPSR